VFFFVYVFQDLLEVRSVEFQNSSVICRGGIDGLSPGMQTSCVAQRKSLSMRDFAELAIEMARA